MPEVSDSARGWRFAYVLLTGVFILTAALNLLGMRAGFLTNHAADLVVPAWMYVAGRGLYRAGGSAGSGILTRMPGPAAGAALFLASAFTELCQLWWPGGVFRGTFDPWDIAAYGIGLAACVAAEILWTPQVHPAAG